MQFFLHILPAILCCALMIPTAYADEFPASPLPTTETVYEPQTENLDPAEYEAPVESTEEPVPEDTMPQPVAPEETEAPETEPTEIPVIPEVTNGPDQDSLLTQLVESQQNTAYATQLLCGFGLFFVVCVLCYFGYKFFRIFI